MLYFYMKPLCLDVSFGCVRNVYVSEYVNSS